MAGCARWCRRRSRRSRLARWEDELVGRVGNDLIDKFAANGKADLVKEFTFDYPSQIIAGLLGLPEEDYPQFQRWSISLLSWMMNPERGLAASAALCDYFAPILEARRAEPTRRHDQPASPRPRSTGRSSPTRRSSRSCGCCCPPASRPRTGRWGTCSSGCCRTRAARRDPRRPLAASAGDRGGGALGIRRC